MADSVQAHNTQAYDALADAFERDYWRVDEENVVNKFFPDTAARLLVAGCGTGRTLPHLAQKGFQITAFDIAPDMVKRAGEKVKDLDGVRVLEADAARLPFADESFEYCFFPFHGIDYVTDREAVLRELKRVLKPGGVLILSSHNLLFPRALLRFLKGPRRGRHVLLLEQGRTLWTYHMFPWTLGSFSKIFGEVRCVPRIRLQALSWHEANWKDRMLMKIPFIDKSMYIICTR